MHWKSHGDKSPGNVRPRDSRRAPCSTIFYSFNSRVFNFLDLELRGMASRPIVLWNKSSNNVVDDGGVNIKKTILPPTLPPAPYIDATRESKEKKYHFMPSLVCFCIQSLYQFPDQIHAIGNISLRYQPPPSPFAYDILRVLIPSYDPNDPNDKTFQLYEPLPPLDLTEVDPRLWATLIQIYENLPYSFNTYPIPLSDPHLPLLQKIPSTPQFTLITVLELPGCTDLTDNTIVELKALHTLCALDASWTKVTTHGIKVLAGTLLWDDETDGNTGRRSRRGPWGLRILRLRHCWKIDNDIFPHLAKFVLLSVLGASWHSNSIPLTCQLPFRPQRNKVYSDPKFTLIPSF